MIRENLKKEIKMFVEMLQQRAHEEGRYTTLLKVKAFVQKKGVYRFLVDFQFLQDQANFCRLTFFDMNSIVL